MTSSSVRGAGNARAGATDTTMLIWKVIAANPGITRDQIWERVEHGIPEGYALRRYSKSDSRKDQHTTGSGSSYVDLHRARRWLFTTRLWEMCRNKSIEQVGDGYRSLREIDYKGNAEAIDIEGTKAAEHLAIADALRTVEKMLTRGSAGPPWRGPKLTRKEYEAVALLAKAHRAKGPA